MIAVIIVSEYLVLIYNKLKGINLRGFLCGIGYYFRYSVRVMIIIREYHSGAMYQTYSAADIEVSEYIKDNTDANGVL